MIKISIIIVSVLIALYVLICIVLFFSQEKLIFFPDKLSKDYQFNFSGEMKEILIETSDRKALNALLFKSGNPKGVIFYLHGNAGSLASWGDVAKTYTDLNYDVFMPDYRGFGKSEGSIMSEKQLFEDAQLAYNEAKKNYPEDRIIVLGYSIGTGFAAKVASQNHPKLLILQAPYYSLSDLVRNKYPMLPGFILKYKLETHLYLKSCTMPVVIFHGNEDEIIDYNFSVKLQKSMKASDNLITLIGQGHNGITGNQQYLREIRRILMP